MTEKKKKLQLTKWCQRQILAIYLFIYLYVCLFILCIYVFIYLFVLFDSRSELYYFNGGITTSHVTTSRSGEVCFQHAQRRILHLSDAD